MDWSEPFNLFDPCPDGAYGTYMHWPELGHDIPWMPPDPGYDGAAIPWQPGTAYGAFLLERYTRWNAATRELDLYYLMSTGSPYQVQLMHTTVRLRFDTLLALRTPGASSPRSMADVDLPRLRAAGLRVTTRAMARLSGIFKGCCDEEQRGCGWFDTKKARLPQATLQALR